MLPATTRQKERDLCESFADVCLSLLVLRNRSRVERSKRDGVSEATVKRVASEALTSSLMDNVAHSEDAATPPLWAEGGLRLLRALPEAHAVSAGKP